METSYTPFDISLSISLPSKASDIPHVLMLDIVRMSNKDKTTFIYSTTTKKFYEFRKNGVVVEEVKEYTEEECEIIKKLILRKLGLNIDVSCLQKLN